jgi:hypothetical protein
VEFVEFTPFPSGLSIPVQFISQVFVFSRCAALVEAQPFFAGRLPAFSQSGSVGSTSLSAGSASS